MKKLLGLLITAFMVVGMMSSSASADVVKGQKYYLKFLKKSCGMTGGDFAKKHTQAEWTAINKDGKLFDEIKTICPNHTKVLKDKYFPHMFDFFFNYASDSGNVPSC